MKNVFKVIQPLIFFILLLGSSKFSWGLCPPNQSVSGCKPSSNTTFYDRYTWTSGVSPKFFWVDYNAGKLKSSNTDGARVTSLLSNLTTPYGVAADPAGTFLYWTSAQEETFKRVNIDGADLRDMPSSFDKPYSITDANSGQTFYLENTTIYQAELDQHGHFSNQVAIVDTEDTAIHGLMFDGTNDRICWGDQYGRLIKCVNRNNGSIIVLLSQDASSPAN